MVTPALVLSIVVGSGLWIMLYGSAAQASSTAPGPSSVQTLAQQADVIVIGDVTSTAGEWDTAGTSIVTRVHLQRPEVLKGAVGAPLSFTRLGGRVGDRMSVVGGAAAFAVGERVLVFLTRDAGTGLRLADIVHGAFRVERDRTTGSEYAVRSTGGHGADRLPLDQVRAEIRRTLGG
jgi:hypothetical protein